MSEHFDKNCLLPSYQSAYRPFFSTETAILKMHHDVLKNMESQKVTAFVALDLSAAFDTVDHAILLSVLKESFGISDNVHHWVQSYLNERKFCVLINNEKSSVKSLDFSVPQGSILGPVLFNAYASTLCSHIEHFNVDLSGYADDHGLYKCFDPKNH